MIIPDVHLMDWDEIDDMTYQYSIIRLVRDEDQDGSFRVFIINENNEYCPINRIISKVWDINLLLLTICPYELDDNEIESLQEDIMNEIRESYGYVNKMMVFNNITKHSFIIDENELFDQGKIYDQRVLNMIEKGIIKIIDFNSEVYPTYLSDVNGFKWDKLPSLDKMFDREKSIETILGHIQR